MKGDHVTVCHYKQTSYVASKLRDFSLKEYALGGIGACILKDLETINFGDGRKVEKELLKKKSKNVLCLNFQSRSLLILAPIHTQCIPFNEAGLFSFK